MPPGVVQALEGPWRGAEAVAEIGRCRRGEWRDPSRIAGASDKSGPPLRASLLGGFRESDALFYAGVVVLALQVWRSSCSQRVCEQVFIFHFFFFSMIIL